MAGGREVDSALLDAAVARAVENVGAGGGPFAAVVVRDGAIVAEGDPREIVDASLVEEVFGLRCLVVPCPATGAPMVVPAAREAV